VALLICALFAIGFGVLWSPWLGVGFAYGAVCALVLKAAAECESFLARWMGNLIRRAPR
jgi:hypothetical protein